MKKFLSCVGLCFLFSGCLVTKADLKDSENHKQTQDQVSSMQKANAENASHFNDVEGSVREMNGRIEVLENRQTQSDQAHAKSTHQLEDQLAESNKKVALLQEELAKVETQMQALSEQMAANSAALTASAAAAAAHPVAEEAPAKGGAEKPTSFDTGEEHFQKKEWKKAIFNYQKYRDSSPKGKKFPEATYKIGVCFQELGMKDEAKTFYEEIISKFPNSAEARRAKIRLKKLK